MDKVYKSSLFEKIRKDPNSYLTNVRNKNIRIYGYLSLIGVISSIIKEAIKRRFEGCPVRILLATENILISNAFLLYGLLTNTYIVIVSSKTMKNYNRMLTIIHSNDINTIVYDGTEYWQSPLLELKNKVILLDSDYIFSRLQSSPFVSLSFGSLRQEKNDIGMSVLSSGSTVEEKLYHLPYNMVYEQMVNFSTFHSDQTMDKSIAIVGNWNQLFAYFSLYPLIYVQSLPFPVGHHFYFYSNISDFKEGLTNTSFRQSLIIFSNELRKVWDNVLLEVNQKKWIFRLNKYEWLKKILSFFLVRKLELFFLKKVRSIHIINDDIGKEMKDVLKTSNIVCTSSYGTLETANFIAYKNPILFSSKKYSSINGGILPRSDKNKYKYILYNSDGGEEGILHLVSEDIMINTHDRCCYIDEYLYSSDENKDIFVCFLDKETNNVSDLNFSVYPEELRYRFRDSLLIRDIVIYKKEGNIYLLIEPRKELLDLQLISYEKFAAFAQEVREKLNDQFTVKIKAHAVLNFNRIRTESGRIALRLL